MIIEMQSLSLSLSLSIILLSLIILFNFFTALYFFDNLFDNLLGFAFVHHSYYPCIAY